MPRSLPDVVSSSSIAVPNPVPIAVPISGPTVDSLVALSQAARDQGADVVELRLDKCSGDPLDIVNVLPRLALPTLVTLRHASEQGDWHGTAQQRRQVYSRADALGAAFIDSELAHFPELAFRPNRARLILSHHDFSGPPADAPGIVAACFQRGAHLAKIAYVAQDAKDLSIAAALPQTAPGPVIALAMGEYGLASRILAPVWGSALTFARLQGDAGTAPGQPTLKELLELYRFRHLRPSTRVYGVLGSPIAHSLSPLMHNHAFAQARVDAVYVPVRAEDPRAFWLACGHLFQGLSITIPHKESLLALLSDIDPLATRIGAINTMSRSGPGKTRGSNSDATAITTCLTAAGLPFGDTGPDQASVNDIRVLVLGAGGAARAAVAACCAANAQVFVTNRTFSRAQSLADSLGATAIPWEQAPQIPWNVLINATSVGLKAPNDTPWPHPFPARGLVFDTVYAPLQTRLIREAKAAGLGTILGVEMFLQQGASQWAGWCGQVAPVSEMRRVVMDRLLS